MALPSLTVTVPVGVPAPGAVTVVDQVTGYATFTAVLVPSVPPFVIDVEVLAWFTVWETPELVLELKSESPG